jgi:two-component system response regulator MtrA
VWNSNRVPGKIPENGMPVWSRIATGSGIAWFFAMTRVLLVEDSADLLYILQIELESLGYEVEAVTNGDAALAAARRRHPDVIVSDLGMPGMDGFDFIKQIRKTPGLRSVPAIALTGASMSSDIQQALAFGFTAHLTKPVEPRELGRRIQQFTARRLERKAG